MCSFWNWNVFHYFLTIIKKSFFLLWYKVLLIIGKFTIIHMQKKIVLSFFLLTSLIKIFFLFNSSYLELKKNYRSYLLEKHAVIAFKSKYNQWYLPSVLPVLLSERKLNYTVQIRSSNVFYYNWNFGIFLFHGSSHTEPRNHVLTQLKNFLRK